jgi:hypothetical protein
MTYCIEIFVDRFSPILTCQLYNNAIYSPESIFTPHFYRFEIDLLVETNQGKVILFENDDIP